MQTKAVEDYLKAVLELEREREKVATTALAQRLQISAASVTGMIKKLARMRLVSHSPYQGVVLTEAGRQIALEVLRHHRLIEAYLAQAMGVPWDQVHAEAEQWEHVLSEEMEDRMDALLGYPATDPHGSPIPSRNGGMADMPRDRLSSLRAGQVAVVAEVADRDPALLRYLGGLGLKPSEQVHVLAVAPFEGPLTLRIGEREQVIGRKVADAVFVQKGPGGRGKASRNRSSRRPDILAPEGS